MFFLEEEGVGPSVYACVWTCVFACADPSSSVRAERGGKVLTALPLESRICCESENPVTELKEACQLQV